MLCFLETESRRKLTHPNRRAGGPTSRHPARPHGTGPAEASAGPLDWDATGEYLVPRTATETPASYGIRGHRANHGISERTGRTFLPKGKRPENVEWHFPPSM